MVTSIKFIWYFIKESKQKQFIVNANLWLKLEHIYYYGLSRSLDQQSLWSLASNNPIINKNKLITHL